MYPKSGGPLWIAGLYELREGNVGGAPASLRAQGEEALGTFTLITRDVDPCLHWLHDRMPIVLDQAGIRAWLDPRAPAPLAALEQRLPSAELAWHPVTKRMSRLDYQEPDVASPAALSSQQQRSVASFFRPQLEAAAERDEDKAKARAEEEPEGSAAAIANVKVELTAEVKSEIKAEVRTAAVAKVKAEAKAEVGTAPTAKAKIEAEAEVKNRRDAASLQGIANAVGQRRSDKAAGAPLSDERPSKKGKHRGVEHPSTTPWLLACRSTTHSPSSSQPVRGDGSRLPGSALDPDALGVGASDARPAHAEACRPHDASRATGGSGHSTALAELREMGFTEVNAMEAALEAAGGDVRKAVAILCG